MAIKFDYTVNTTKDFEKAAVDIRKSTEAKGWTVLQVYDMKEMMAVKGFELSPLKLFEICSAKYAYQFLKKDKLVSLCMPCRISLYEENGEIFISGMRPILMGEFFPHLDLGELPVKIDEDLREIVDKAK
ncbi:MAG: DUF302 domain-containing protein [Candidatus Zixiibacteriota bacterium]|jgi:uncharacterized protein (DUF302 family)|nr:DUF302 domain-containing protein [candidate division Zixibacteria bacterium]